MNNQRQSTICVIVFAIVFSWSENAKIAHGQRKPSDELNVKVTNTLDGNVIPAYRRGDSFSVLTSLSPLVARMSEPQIDLVNQHLDRQSARPVGELLLEARMALITQKQSSKLPRAGLREALLLIPAIQTNADNIQKDYNNHAIVKGKAPTIASLEDYENIFWELHVLKNRLRNAGYQLQYAGTLTSKKLAGKRKSLSPSEREILDYDADTKFGELTQHYEMLEQYRVELRLHRLETAANIIRDSDDFRERMLAAFCIDLDGHWLDQFFKNGGAEKATLASLKKPNLGAETRTKVKKLRKEAGSLVEKSRLLYTGLHWWMRGRYGKGPDGMGLLKSKWAVTSPAAQFGLYMPRVTPKPTSGSHSQSVPEVDRRHHYIWMYEYRQASLNFSHKTDRKITDYKSTGVRTELSHFY